MGGQDTTQPVSRNLVTEWASMLISQGESLVRIAYNNETTASFIAPVRYDLACPALQAALAANPGGLGSLIGGNSPPDLSSLANYSNLTAMGGGLEVGY